MSTPAREFCFSVDTEEVATTMAPPAPVIAQPKRRVAAPTVALRLPNLTEAPIAAATPAPAQLFAPWSAPEPIAPPPAPILPVEVPLAFVMPPAPQHVEAEAEVAEEPAPTPPPKPKKTKAKPPVEESEEATEFVAIASEQEPLWKNPKFMLAGVAAAFLGMVSLMAMKHEDGTPLEDAPAWETADSDAPQWTPATPVAQEGVAASAPPPLATEVNTATPRTAQNTASRQNSTPIAQGAAVETFSSGQQWNGPITPPAATVQSGYYENATAAEETDGSASLLGNIYVPGEEREAAHTDSAYPSTNR